MSVRTVVFDVGETLVDERRTRGLQVDALGVSRAVLCATLGAVIDARLRIDSRAELPDALTTLG